jgi:hypothetical protein
MFAAIAGVGVRVVITEWKLAFFAARNRMKPDGAVPSAFQRLLREPPSFPVAQCIEDSSFVRPDLP